MKSNQYLVYSCSGCSNLAQMANTIALRLDRENLAEMSCIAGIGGNVPSLVKKAKSGRSIAAIDGCSLACVRACLDGIGIQPDKHYILTEFGYRKKFRKDATPESTKHIFEAVRKELESSFEQS